jgi:hypothetical protein
MSSTRASGDAASAGAVSATGVSFAMRRPSSMIAVVGSAHFACTVTTGVASVRVAPSRSSPTLCDASTRGYDTT